MSDYTAVRVRLRVMTANLQVLALKALESHWNVRGVHFGPLHAFFGDQYEFLLATQDTLAERIRALEGLVPANDEGATLAKVALAGKAPAVMLQALLTDYRVLIAEFRSAVGAFETAEPITANMLQEICAQFEKRAWMLRMYLTPEGGAA